MPVTVIVIIAIIVVAVMAVAGPYNALVTLRQRYKNAFAQIDVQPASFRMCWLRSP